MRTFKRVYYKPFELTVQLTDEEEQKIIKNLKEDGFKEGSELFEDCLEEAISDILYDKFYKLEKKYERETGIAIEPNYNEDIEEEIF